MTPRKIRIEPLDGHRREDFSCQMRRVQHFFRKWASENHTNYKQRVFVACAEDEKEPLGFYSLTLMTFEASMAEEAEAKYQKRPVPTIYMGAIARDKKLSDPGLGAILLADALKRCLAVRENVGVYALSLHAANERLAALYETYGFSRFENSESMPDENGNLMPAMFFRLADAAAALDEVNEA